MNLTIELTASPALLDAINNLTAAFTGRGLNLPDLSPVGTSEPVSQPATEAPAEAATETTSPEPVVEAPKATRRRNGKAVASTETATSDPEPAAEPVAETTAPAPVTQTQKASDEPITIERVRAAVRAKTIDEGKREEAVELLKTFGSPNVTNLDPAKYSEFLEKLNAL